MRSKKRGRTPSFNQLATAAFDKAQDVLWFSGLQAHTVDSCPAFHTPAPA